MDQQQRKQLRHTLLSEVYQHYHKSGGEKYIIKILQSETEKLLAYKYLHNKRYIEMSYVSFGDDYQVDAKLLVDGIDKVES